MKVKNALAVYLHIPFCRVRCPYCDFNTYSGMQSLVPAYVEALCRVIAREGAASGLQAARTVYFGGGTPSLLEPQHVARILKAVDAVLPLTADCEITLEANPVTADAERFAGFRAAGVNRLSFGVQSLNDRLLKVLGRDHSAEQAKRGLLIARQAGFENVSLDLMYAVPNQSLADWQHDVEQALALAPEHLSLYCLTVEPTTPYARWVANGRIKLPADDIAADMYASARERLAGAGYEHYEISNWALPDKAGEHNSIYWRYEPYLGLGAGAHGYLDSVRTEEIRAPRTYIERAFSGESTVLHQEDISQATAMEETVFLNLRLLQRGILRQEFAARFGVDPVILFGEVVEDLTRANLICVDKNSIRLTSNGYFLANEVCVRLMTALESGMTTPVSVSSR
ncbi:MAG: radical SAM family heme chaperone HemW [Chloroflexi bacterium]|nr:radical SAM family heme chaperone HemW [Chloroflexota bacterium]